MQITPKCLSGINTPEFSDFSLFLNNKQQVLLFKVRDRCPHFTPIPAGHEQCSQNLRYSAQRLTQQCLKHKNPFQNSSEKSKQVSTITSF